MKGGGVCAVDPVLYAILKDLRKKIAKKLELPPYVIFQDPSLEAMATTYPVTLDELQNIPGVGAGKAKRYGEEFVKVIKKHCDENEIERPEDLRVRTVANKSKLKVSIIQGIDRKIALDELAESKGLEFSDLLDEVEAIVYSGTKIHIDYFLDEVMDEDHVEDIFDYFKEAESDDLEAAIEEWVENIPRKKSDWSASSSFRKWVIDFFIIHIERVEISTLFYYAKNKTIKRVKKIFYFSILAKKCVSLRAINFFKPNNYVIYCRQNRNGRIDIRRCIVDPRLFRSPPTRGRSLNPFFP